jgi:hypothetical protein
MVVNPSPNIFCILVFSFHVGQMIYLFLFSLNIPILVNINNSLLVIFVHNTVFFYIHDLLYAMLPKPNHLCEKCVKVLKYFMCFVILVEPPCILTRFIWNIFSLPLTYQTYLLFVTGYFKVCGAQISKWATSVPWEMKV